MQFFIPLKKIPSTTHQQGSRTTKAGRHYKDAALLELEALYAAHLFPFRPSAPMAPPVRLLVKFLYPITPGSRHYDGEPKTTKPDTDNLVKALKDAMARLGFFGNDAHVYSETVEKFWADTPGIFVSAVQIPSQEPPHGQTGGAVG